jgi:hypothetical protein
MTSFLKNLLILLIGALVNNNYFISKFNSTKLKILLICSIKNFKNFCGLT